MTSIFFFNNTTVFSKYYAGALSSAIDDKKERQYLSLYERIYLGECASQLDAD